MSNSPSQRTINSPISPSHARAQVIDLINQTKARLEELRQRHPRKPLSWHASSLFHEMTQAAARLDFDDDSPLLSSNQEPITPAGILVDERELPAILAIGTALDFHPPVITTLKHGAILGGRRYVVDFGTRDRDRILAALTTLSIED